MWAGACSEACTLDGREVTPVVRQRGWGWQRPEGQVGLTGNRTGLLQRAQSSARAAPRAGPSGVIGGRGGWGAPGNRGLRELSVPGGAGMGRVMALQHDPVPLQQLMATPR